MKIFIRSFNPDINSKTGADLPEGQTRGTPQWLEFEDVFFGVLKDLGHELLEQPENPRFPDGSQSYECQKRIYVHKTKRDVPNGDLFYMQMHMRYLFTVDTKGWGVDHSDKDNFMHEDINEEEAEDLCIRLSSEFLITGLSKCEQPYIGETEETPKNFILVPLQIPRDYTILHHSPVTVKYFVESVAWWAEETKNHVGFKMHPFNKHDQDLIDAVDAACKSKYCHVVNGNIHELIKRSKGVFTINSGTGFEALIHGKPVATFGDADYNKVTWNADLMRLDEARNFIYSYQDYYRKIAYKYVLWYHENHAFNLQAMNLKERLTSYLKGELC